MLLMCEKGKNRIFLKSAICIEMLNLAIKSFNKFLSDRTSSDLMTYYQAHKYLKEGKIFYQEALNEARNLLSPLPIYATPSFREWKEGYLKRIGIIVEKKEFEDLKSDLQSDEFLLRFLTPEKIDVLLRKHYESQQVGKRKLSNIKARIILDEIKNLVTDAEASYMMSKNKLYQLK